MLKFLSPILLCLLYVLSSPHSLRQATPMMDLFRDQTPGCYMNAVTELVSEKIHLGEFFKRCLAHLGPPEQRVHHLPDDSMLSDFIRPLMWTGKRFGPMACAIKFCEADSLIASFPGEKLAPFFSACASGQADMAALKNCSPTMSATDADRITTVPLFCQAMFFTALNTGNPALAIKIVDEKPLVNPPPPEKWLFGGHILQLSRTDMEQEQIPLGVWAAAVRNKWTPATWSLLYNAVTADDEAGSIDLLDSIQKADSNFLDSEPWHKHSVFEGVLKSGTPEVLQHLWKLYKVPEEDRLKDHMLIEAAINKKPGGLRMLGWLLDQGLNVNYRRVTESDEEVPYLGDPREAAERFYQFQQAPISRRKTALHEATRAGNVEGVKYLLSRGANVDAQDGLGQTARFIAQRDGHVDVVTAIDEFVKETR
ncbi:hypothetical protein V8C35DRAFT_110041 [Trichoderma chlorosporum]